MCQLLQFRFLLIPFIFFTISAMQAQECDQFRTQTQGGWGSKANGNNPGVYRDAHFLKAFPYGLIIGCDYTLTFTSASAIEKFLPQGGPPSIFSVSIVDPISIQNVFAGQLVALTLSVGFDKNDPSFSDSETLLEDQVITSGAFEGFFVKDILELANQMIGGCSSSYSASQLNNVLSAINENYVDGTSNNGFLECPPEVPCELAITHCSDQEVILLSCKDDIPPADPGNFEVINACGPVTSTFIEHVSGVGCTSDPEIITRTYSFSDGVTSLSCDQVFRIVDNVPPIIECPAQVTLNCDGNLPPADMATATDNCDNDVSINYTDGPIQNCDQFFRTWRATDDCGNTAFCQQVVLIQDNVPPVVQAPIDRTISCVYPTDPSFTGTATALDECSSVILDYFDGPINGDDCMYTFIRTWTATDACGNVAMDDQLIRVLDLQAPDIVNAPPNQILQCGDIPELPTDVYAIDACSHDTLPVEVTENITDNHCLIFIQRIFTATDNCGNTSSTTRTIQIGDTQGPSMNCPQNVLLECGSNIPGPETLGEATAIDQCSGDEVEITFSDGPINYSLCPPRAQRVWTAIDTCGNSTQCIQLIQFEDTDAPELECPGDAVVDCSEDQSMDPNFTGFPVGDDACSNITYDYSDSDPVGSCPVNIVRTWTVSDACGNTTSCSQSIQIVDDVAPQILCPADYTANCGLVDTPIHLSGVAMVEGECLEVDISFSDGPLTGECPQRYVRTWTAVDACDNSSSCEQIIYLEDTMLPVINCPADTAVLCGTDTSPSLLGQAMAIDYCSSVTVEYKDEWTSDNCTEVILRTWTATDACGNNRSCIQRIELLPSGSISITCPPDLTLACGSDTSIATTGEPITNLDCGTLNTIYRDSIVEAASGMNDCGPLRTQTQGGWGTTAHGNNPGTYRDAHFEKVFPNGLVVGCNYTLTLTNSNAVELFLPTKGGMNTLTSDLVDPINYKSSLAGQLVALTLSVGFDAWDPDFGQANVLLGNMVMNQGPMTGMTVNEILVEANAVFGGCKPEFSINDIHESLTAINENYVDGTVDKGVLDCTEGEEYPGCLTIYRTFTATACNGHSASCTQVIKMIIEAPIQEKVMEATLDFKLYPSPTEGFLFLESDDITTGDRIEVRDFSGKLMKVFYSRDDGTTMVDIGDLENGLYLVLCYIRTEPMVARILKI